MCNVTHQGAARSGPVVLHPVRATPCCNGGGGGGSVSGSTILC